MTEQAERLAPQSDPMARFMRVVGRIFGIVFLVAGLAWLGQEIRFGRTARSASGTIVEVRARESAGGPEFYPVVEFAAQDGRVIRFDGVSTSPPPVAGTPVKVLYDPAQPNNARISSFVQRWLLAAVFASMGVVFLAALSLRQVRARGAPRWRAALFPDGRIPAWQARSWSCACAGRHCRWIGPPLATKAGCDCMVRE